MRCKTCLVAVAVALFTLSVSVCFGAETADAPSVFFPETQYEFSPVLEDATVVHDFVIKNKGNAPLNVDRVKTG